MRENILKKEASYVRKCIIPDHREIKQSQNIETECVWLSVREGVCACLHACA